MRRTELALQLKPSLAQLLFPNYENRQAASMLAADLRFIIIGEKQIQSWQQILSCILRNIIVKRQIQSWQQILS